MKFCNIEFNILNKTRVWDAYGPHIAEGPHLIHDMERSHAVPVEKLGLRSTAYGSKEISKLPDKDDPLHDVNRLCFLLELFLNSHSGFGRERLGGYLDLFHVMMNPPADKIKKATLVLNRAMSIPKSHLRGPLFIDDRQAVLDPVSIWRVSHFTLSPSDATRT